MASPLHAVLERLFDDAGLFPPLNRPMAEALRDHAAVLQGPHGRAVGPFLCPAPRLAELDACMAAGIPRPPAIGVVGYDTFAGWRAVYATAGLVHVEVPSTGRVPSPPGRVRRYVEIGPHADLDRALDAVPPGDGVKVRGAGPVSYSVPGVDWLARRAGGVRGPAAGPQGRRRARPPLPQHASTARSATGWSTCWRPRAWPARGRGSTRWPARSPPRRTVPPACCAR